MNGSQTYMQQGTQQQKHRQDHVEHLSISKSTPKKERILKDTLKHTLTIILFLALLLTIPQPVVGLEKVIANSADWKDVYSSMLYASLNNIQPGLFLTSSRHGTILLYSVSKSANGTLILSSRNQPYIVNYKTTMEAQGYQDVEEIISNNINLELAERLLEEQNIRKFIIVDDAYGYNALSSASYAVASQQYVIFANERNIGAVDSFLSDADPQSILIVGQVDEAVKTRLAQYNPETINKGDRFDNNIEVVRRYLQTRDTKQVLVSNGEFIEASIMSGQDPVVFIGRGTVPPQVQEFIKEEDFQVAVLIGNDLINSATEVRRQLGISVFVKFAQGARSPTGAIAAVEDLDKFFMPRYLLNLGIYSILYNKASNSLWITYRNLANLGSYLKGTITLNVDGTTRVVGDQDVVFIDKNKYKTITYDVQLAGENITANIYTIFGEGRKSLENVLEGSLEVQTVDILDDSRLNITDVSYDKRKQAFVIELENIGIVDTYANVEMIDLFVNGELLTIASTETLLLKPEQTGTFLIEVELSDNDIRENPIVKVKAYYGERENSLFKTIYGEYAFKFVSIDIVFYTLIVLIILLLLLILFGRKKCPHCGTRNSRLRKICRVCKHSLHHPRKEHAPPMHGEQHHEHHPKEPQQ